MRSRLAAVGAVTEHTLSAEQEAARARAVACRREEREAHDAAIHAHSAALHQRNAAAAARS